MLLFGQSTKEVARRQRYQLSRHTAAAGSGPRRSSRLSSGTAYAYTAVYREKVLASGVPLEKAGK